MAEHGELVLGADRGRAGEHHHDVRVTGYLEEKIGIVLSLNFSHFVAVVVFDI